MSRHSRYSGVALALIDDVRHRLIWAPDSLYKNLTDRLPRPYVPRSLLKKLKRSPRRNILFSFPARYLGSRECLTYSIPPGYL